jgi:hypothetical protein
MSKSKNSVIEVHGTTVSIRSGSDGDYISLTDMLQAKDDEFFFSDRETGTPSSFWVSGSWFSSRG